MRACGLYSVIGVKADNTRILLESGISLARGEHIMRILVDARAFPQVLIEPDDEKSPESPSQ